MRAPFVREDLISEHACWPCPAQETKTKLSTPEKVKTVLRDEDITIDPTLSNAELRGIAKRALKRRLDGALISNTVGNYATVGLLDRALSVKQLKEKKEHMMATCADVKVFVSLKFTIKHVTQPVLSHAEAHDRYRGYVLRVRA